MSTRRLIKCIILLSSSPTKGIPALRLFPEYLNSSSRCFRVASTSLRSFHTYALHLSTLAPRLRPYPSTSLPSLRCFSSAQSLTPGHATYSLDPKTPPQPQSSSCCLLHPNFPFNLPPPFAVLHTFSTTTAAFLLVLSRTPLAPPQPRSSLYHPPYNLSHNHNPPLAVPTPLPPLQASSSSFTPPPSPPLLPF